MTFKIHTDSIDFAANKATIMLLDSNGGGTVMVTIHLSTLGDQPESQLREASLAAAKAQLKAALDFL